MCFSLADKKTWTKINYWRNYCGIEWVSRIQFFLLRLPIQHKLPHFKQFTSPSAAAAAAVEKRQKEIDYGNHERFSEKVTRTTNHTSHSSYFKWHLLTQICSNMYRRLLGSIHLYPSVFLHPKSHPEIERFVKLCHSNSTYSKGQEGWFNNSEEAREDGRWPPSTDNINGKISQLRCCYGVTPGRKRQQPSNCCRTNPESRDNALFLRVLTESEITSSLF